MKCGNVAELCENWQRVGKKERSVDKSALSLSLSLILCAFTVCRVGAWVVCSSPRFSAPSSSSSCCCCFVCYIIICKHLSIMQQQREQHQQQPHCWPATCNAPKMPQARRGKARQGEQPQERPTGHINIPHRPQYTQTRAGPS